MATGRDIVDIFGTGESEIFLASDIRARCQVVVDSGKDKPCISTTHDFARAGDLRRLLNCQRSILFVNSYEF